MELRTVACIRKTNRYKSSLGWCISFFLMVTFSFLYLFSPAGVFISNIKRRPEIKVYYPGSSKYDNANANRIYFHETTRRKHLTERQSCAVESAARNNPDRPVQLFMLHTGGIDYSVPWLGVLSQYPNVEIVFIKEEEYFRGTPLEAWFAQDKWRSSPHKNIHLSDYLRMASAYKGGGLYLDIDVITLKRYDTSELKNFFVVEEMSANLLCNSVFHLESDHRFVKEIIDTLATDYKPDAWGHHGGDLITAIMSNSCGFVKGNSAQTTNTCNDVKLLPYKSFLGMIPEEYELMFRVATDYSANTMLNESYGVHLWNTKGHHEYVDFSSENQLFSLIARKHCPLTAIEGAKCSNTIT